MQTSILDPRMNCGWNRVNLEYEIHKMMGEQKFEQSLLLNFVYIPCNEFGINNGKSTVLISFGRFIDNFKQNEW